MCRFSLLLVTLCISILPLDGRVVRVEVSSRARVLEGRAFGKTGAYERLSGRVYFSVPIDNPHNVRIVDLRNAVSLSHGEVGFSADFIAIRPEDAHKGNGSMILEIPNRGHAAITRLVDGGDSSLTEPGDAWLLRKGFTVVTLGWQWDAPGADSLRLYAPIAKANGKTITGLLRGDLMPSSVMPVIPLGHLILGRIGGTEYPVAAPEDPAMY